MPPCRTHHTGGPWSRTREGNTVCTHEPACPSSASPDSDAAVIVVNRPGRGWARLGNGVTLFAASECGHRVA
ncbi:DUF5999 family protein [Streptomyces sp. IBSNAI002]|uniref:DUF5999 family protein n=1 Tax=Streptomyces sp. IBSNAI002 TaxID=3457500 RepID=UPI003FD4A828